MGKDKINQEAINMKKFILLLFIMIIFIFSCATVKKSPWQKHSYDYYVYIPEKIYNFEEALANLQNIQSDLWINGRQPSEITVDKYSFRAKLKWTETYSQTDYVPSFGGFFIGWNYVPVYSGSYQTSYSNVQKEDIIILPFKDISDIILGLNHLYINLNTGKSLTFYLSNFKLVQKMADSIFSLFQIINDERKTIIGFSYDETDNEEKLSYLNKKSKVVYVKLVLKNGPADLAGLTENDIILEINSEKINDANQCSKLLSQGILDYINNKKIIKIRVFHFEETKDKIVNWEERLIKLKPASL